MTTLSDEEMVDWANASIERNVDLQAALEAANDRIAELEALIAKAIDLIIDQVETENSFELEWDKAVRKWLALAKQEKNDE